MIFSYLLIKIKNYLTTTSLSVDYAKFVPYLIKLVQMQQKEINELRADVQSIIERSL